MYSSPRAHGFPHLHSQSGALRWPLALLFALLFSAILYVALQTSPPAESASPNVPTDEPTSESSAFDRPTAERESAPQKPLPTSGGIRGRLNLPVGTPAPEEWELVLMPSRFYKSGNAVERRIHFADQVVDFVITDLPLGTYDVRPRAAGMNSNWLPISLTPESSEPYIDISMTPAGTLTGRVEYANGAPSEGVMVRVARVGFLDEEDAHESSTETDLSGRYEFPSLPDGEYELRFGEDLNPLLKPKQLAFVAPSMHLPPQVLKRVGRITVVVLDDGGNPLPDVNIVGSGRPGGFIDHFTDALGECHIAGLPAGSFKIRTEHPGFQTSQKLVELVAGENAIVRFSLSL
ncbi:MAG: hypothetical protein ACI8TQ_001890 [Planctomycetota bacterium]|jgi:hypothetical protein